MTNGDRPDDALGRQLRPAYSPRRRRNDVAVTGVIGFLVGAIAGLATLALISLISWLTVFIVGFVGFLPTVFAAMLIGGIVLAISAVRSSE